MRIGVAVLAAFAPLILGACGAPAATSSDQVTTASAAPETLAPSMTAAPSAELQLGQSFGLVYDPALGRTILVNGAIEGGPARPTELWTWDGAVFERLDADGPPAREFPAIARDPERDVIVVTGGERPSTAAPATTMEWDGMAWTEHPEVGPGPGSRGGTSLAYDAASDAMLLFGAPSSSTCSRILGPGTAAPGPKSPRAAHRPASPASWPPRPTATSSCKAATGSLATMGASTTTRGAGTGRPGARSPPLTVLGRA
jgi:hypothetical protein